MREHCDDSRAVSKQLPQKRKKPSPQRMWEGRKVIERTELPATASPLWVELAMPVPGESRIKLATKSRVMKSEEKR